MKFSQMDTDHATGVLCEIAQYLEPIITDKDFIQFLQEKIIVSNNASRFELYGMGFKKLLSLIPILLKTHKDECYQIISVMNEKDVDTVRKQNLLVTLNELREILNDKDLISFFKSCVAQEQNEQ